MGIIRQRLAFHQTAIEHFIDTLSRTFDKSGLFQYFGQTFAAWAAVYCQDIFFLYARRKTARIGNDNLVGILLYKYIVGERL
jgi:hypothetical protein